MTSALMLQTLRSWLDEATNGFWDNTVNLYPSLANGQREYSAIILAQYLARLNSNLTEPIPFTLLPLYKEYIATIPIGENYFTKPVDFQIDLALRLSSAGIQYPTRKRDLGPAIFFKQENPYEVSNLGFYNIDATNVNIERGSITGAIGFEFMYLTIIPDITVSIQPILPDFTHVAICQYAFAEALLKAKLRDDATIAFNKFLQLVQYR